MNNYISKIQKSLKELNCRAPSATLGALAPLAPSPRLCHRLRSKNLECALKIKESWSLKKCFHLLFSAQSLTKYRSHFVGLHLSSTTHLQGQIKAGAAGAAALGPHQK